MYVENGILTLKYEPTDPRLGRHMELDSRSTQYGVSLQEQAAKPVNQDWASPIPIMDQGQLGSCTGNAGTRFIAWKYRDNLSAVTLSGKNLGQDATADEQFAVELYHEATVNDGFSGTYPPDDTGSSGLGVMRSFKKAKLVTSYVHAFSLRSLVAMLQKGPYIQGMPWYNAFFEPDSNGFIDSNPNWQPSGVAGGHEIFCRGVELLSGWSFDTAPEKIVLNYDNSWNTSWGDHGSFRMRGSTYQALKQQIDVMQGR
jgi:hypothetical protein